MEKRIVNKIILIGAGASGKDYAKTTLTKFGLKSDVSYTTRMPRIGETNGKDYIFISETEMLRMISKNELLQWNQLDSGACYGTSVQEWENKSVFIMTPNVLSIIKKQYSDAQKETDYVVIGFDISSKIRAERMSKTRNWNDKEIAERILIDNGLFKNVEVDIMIKNPNFNDVELLNSIFSNDKYDTLKLKESLKSQ